MDSSSTDKAELIAFAQSRGGQLLSTEFGGRASVHRWRCALDHEFEASPGLLIDGGYWCPECFPSAVEGRGWDWARQVDVDPLLASFYRKG